MNSLNPPGNRSRLFIGFRTGVAVADKISRVIVIIALGLMTTIVSVQVLMRYGFNYSIDSADETARLLFVWSIFLGIPHGLRYGIHVGIDVLTALMPKQVQETLFRFMSVCSAVLMVIVANATIYVAADKWGDLMPTVNVTAAVFYIAVLIAAVHSIFHLALLAWGGSDTWHDVDHVPNSSGLETIQEKGA